MGNVAGRIQKKLINYTNQYHKGKTMKAITFEKVLVIVGIALFCQFIITVLINLFIFRNKKDKIKGKDNV